MSKLDTSQGGEPKTADAVTDGAGRAEEEIESYAGFPDFQQWANLKVGIDRWEEYTALLNSHGELSDERWRDARETVKRAAAIETGILEDLYDLPRGKTISACAQAAYWEAALNQEEEKTRSLIRSQLEAYEYVLHFASGEAEILPAWIRQLQTVMCRAQGSYEVKTSQGVQVQELPLGQYKTEINYVHLADGRRHFFCPPDHVDEEVDRFCEQLRSEDFKESHPVLQASYAHYALAQIHPFQDGNGRVARALASVFTYRSHQIPLLISRDNKGEYLDALEFANGGNYQSFVDFIQERAIDAIKLVDESLRVTKVAAVEDLLLTISGQYRTRGGYSHVEVDKAGYLLFKMFYAEMNRKFKEEVEGKGGLKCQVQGVSTSEPKLVLATSRWPISEGKREMEFKITSPHPGAATVRYLFTLEVPKNCDIADQFVIAKRNEAIAFTARITELLPKPSLSFEIRLRMGVDGIVREALAELSKLVSKKMKEAGYKPQ